MGINGSVNTLQELANAINTASTNGGTGTPSEFAKATVVTNGDGTQSLSLASTAGNGALTVTAATTGNAAAAPAFSGLVTAQNATTADLQTASDSNEGTATNTGVKGSLTLGVSTTNPNNVTDSSADTVSGKIVLTDGTMPAQTFVMGGTAATTTASNSITTITVKGNNMSDLATAIAAQLNANGDTGATAVAGNSGLVITSGTKGNTIAATTNDLLNTNATLGAYTPDDSGTGVYGTALLALTSTDGSQITGTIGASDTLVGSVVLTDGTGAAETFTMGGTAEAYADNTVTVNGSTAGDLLTAINDFTAGSISGQSAAPAGFSITATTDAGGSGGLYLQSGTQGNDVTVDASGLSDAIAENNPTTVDGQAVVAGTAASLTVGPATGSVNSGDTLAGGIAITNTVDGKAVTHTFVLGGTSANAGLAGSTYTVNGSTLGDLAAAVTADTALGLTGLASTEGLGLTATGPSYRWRSPNGSQYADRHHSRDSILGNVGLVFQRKRHAFRHSQFLCRHIAGQFHPGRRLNCFQPDFNTQRSH